MSLLGTMLSGRSLVLTSFVVLLNPVLNTMCKAMGEACAGDACTMEMLQSEKKKVLLQVTREAFDAKVAVEDEEEGNRHGGVNESIENHGKPRPAEVRLPWWRGGSRKQAALGQSKLATKPSLVVHFFNFPSTVRTERDWATAMRTLMTFCNQHGYRTGVPTGYKGIVHGSEVRGVFCLKGTGVDWFNAPMDASHHCRFDVVWSVCLKTVRSKCRAGHYITGLPDGHTSGSHRGSYCFKNGRFIKRYAFNVDLYDLTSSEINQGKDGWGHQMRTVGGLCRERGWDWGIPTGRFLYKERTRPKGTEAYCFKNS
jgi:hypothetical protein